MITVAGALAVGALPLTKAMAAAVPGDSLPWGLRDRALDAFERHRTRFAAHDVIGLVDYAAPSRSPRFHILDLDSGRVNSLFVAHGRGSDRDHSGWLQHFSNEPGSAASSAGAYMTGDAYDGSNGSSRRLIGLDAQNSNAEARAIVIHPAWYVSSEMARTHGKLGRSEGCFAFSETDIAMVLDRLGPGRMIYADKV
ncbi:MAG: murein L,D-transpeptidase catalytic domain family protein [Parasphingopyxis sp.]